MSTNGIELTGAQARYLELERENAELRAAIWRCKDHDNAFERQIEHLTAERAKLRAFVERIAKQRPEKPDYWTECGQCGRNALDADDIINPL